MPADELDDFLLPPAIEDIVAHRAAVRVLGVSHHDEPGGWKIPTNHRCGFDELTDSLVLLQPSDEKKAWLPVSRLPLGREVGKVHAGAHHLAYLHPRREPILPEKIQIRGVLDDQRRAAGTREGVESGKRRREDPRPRNPHA
ncbi:hypothetical protein DDZ14_18765 [Maritimibacter sp. 55A14]|nr:hypothetical protein DDZ14_18765 [Maritimibacter sp. 55A14]